MARRPTPCTRCVALPGSVEAPLAERDMVAGQVHHARLRLAAGRAFQRFLVMVRVMVRVRVS